MSHLTLRGLDALSHDEIDSERMRSMSREWKTRTQENIESILRPCACCPAVDVGTLPNKSMMLPEVISLAARAQNSQNLPRLYQLGWAVLLLLRYGGRSSKGPVAQNVSLGGTKGPPR